MFRAAVASMLVISAGAGAAPAYDWNDGLNLQKKEGDQYALIFSPYTRHFTEDGSHSHVWLIGVERERADHALAGAAFFTNSFGQPSAYIYPWGKTFHELLGQPQLYAKLTAGVIYGYRGEHKDKIPFNQLGIAPAIVPAIGWDLGDGFQLQGNLLGFNGMMFQLTLPLK